MTMTEDIGPSAANRIEPAKLVQLTTNIVAAYVSRNVTSPSDLPSLIGTVSRGLLEISHATEEATSTKPEPAVPVRRSIKPDWLSCLVECP
jgi:predicted transcriptional regulator